MPGKRLPIPRSDAHFIPTQRNGESGFYIYHKGNAYFTSSLKPTVDGKNNFYAFSANFPGSLYGMKVNMHFPNDGSPAVNFGHAVGAIYAE